ncbi:hypothetical protein DFQ27_003759 [Actinomortierella ambigua]|uniref:Pali-domain-containing protein n=1 Tax=Actinomortierella ambigua TaxID=1343610 RepID=A0A9P6Q6I6_9FUNG|nr:hypothetical protein DFQ27_003759 [Actinomortierella ambigua]
MLLFVVVSFFVNLVTTAAFFLINVGDLHPAQFFSSFYFEKVAFISGKGLDGKPLNLTFDFVTFGAFGYCQGAASEIQSCSNAHIHYTMKDILVLHQIESQFIPSAVRGFSKITVLFIPTVCVAFVAFLLAALALKPRFRKRWIHVVVTFLSILISLAAFLLTLCVFTVSIARKIQYERHLNTSGAEPNVKVYLGPALWLTLALLPWTAFGAVFGGFAVCCPGRISRSLSSSPRPEDVRVQVHTASEKKAEGSPVDGAHGLTAV